MRIINKDIFNHYMDTVGWDRLDTMIDIFVTDINQRFLDAKLAHKNNDIDSFKREIHTIKSVGKTIGVEKLGQYSENMEDVVLDNGLSSIDISEFEGHVKEAVDSLIILAKNHKQS